MGIAVPVTQLPCNITSQLSQASLLSALQQNFAAIVAGLQSTQGYINGSVAPVIDLSSIANSEILGSQVAGFARPSVAYTEEGVQVQTHIPRYEQIDTNDFLYGLLMEEGTTNLAKDAGFETGNQPGTGVWSSMQTPGAGESVTNAAGWGFGGSGYGMRVTALGHTSYLGVTQTLTGWTAGETLTVSVRVSVTAYVAGNIRGDISGSKTSISMNIVSGTTSGYVTISGTGTVGAGETALSVRLFADGTPNATFTYDNVQVENKAYATSPIIAADTTTQATRSPETMIIPTANIFTPGSWTVEMRYTPTSNPAKGGSKYADIFQLTIDAGDNYNLYINPSGQIYGAVRSGSTAYQTASSPACVIGTEYSIMLSGNGSTLTLCINGVQIGAIAYVEPVGALPTTFNVGAGTDGCVNGLLDDLRISNIAHTITDHKNYISSNQPLPVDANTTLKMDFDQTLRQTSVQRLTNIQGTFTIADQLTTNDSSKATHIVPTGWTTAEATIMQAMSELPATGGSIVLLDGTFWITVGAVATGSSIVVIGQGSSTILKAAAAHANLLTDNYYAVTAQTAITLSTLSLNGNGFLSTGIQLTSTTGATVTNIEITNCSPTNSIGLDISLGNTLSSNNNIINGLTCQNNYIGMYVLSNNTTISNCQVNNNTSVGIELWGNYNQINNCQINNNGQHGIYAYGGTHNTITGNNAESNSQSATNTYSNIQISGSYDNIQNNTCRKGLGPIYPYAGIQIAPGSAANLASSNDCYTGGQTAGISDSGTSTSFGSGNRVNSGAWSTTPS